MLEYLILIVLRTLSIEHDIPSKGGHTTILPETFDLRFFPNGRVALKHIPLAVL